MTTTRSYADLPQPATEALPSRFDAPRGGRWAWRLRLVLLLVIAVPIGLGLLSRLLAGLVL